MMDYQRTILNELEKWKANKQRKPLVLRGARQVGKTTLVNLFAKSFDQYIYLNLEKAEDKKFFDAQKTVHETIDAIFFEKNKPKSNHNTLIFIDEIQEVPEAINSLRYFYEDYSYYSFIAAGSLLENALSKLKSFPVGRVEFKVVRPFSFEEFLMAAKEDNALDQYRKIPVDNFATEKLLKLFHTYTLIGGMPEIIKNYLEHRDLVQLKPVYSSLIASYIDDVEKYAKGSVQAQILQHAIRTCFSEASSRIRFNGFGSSSYKSREMGEALRMLEKTRLIELVYPTTQAALPYQADVKKLPRLHLLDTGMVNFFAGLQLDVFNSKDLSDVYKGRIIEHIIGQELLASKSDALEHLTFWVRNKKDSMAALDYLYLKNGKAYPIEVKSGKIGKLKSLLMFIDVSGINLAIRLYAGDFTVEQHQTPVGNSFTLLNLPYFLVGKIDGYIEKFLP